MRYIKLENNQPENYTIEQLMIDYPNAIIYKISQLPDEQLLAQYNVYPLITEALPELQEDEAASESTPEFRDGEWHQTWTVRKLTEQEINEMVALRAGADSFTDTPENLTEFIASKDLQQQRYEICKTCDSFTMLKTCRECGCIMPLKVKIASVSCPLKKW
jgi:hypothetical protein